MLALPGIIDQILITDTTPVIEPTYPFGLFHYYGRMRNTEAWQNPISRGVITVGTPTGGVEYTTTGSDAETPRLADRVNDENMYLQSNWASTTGQTRVTDVEVKINFPEPVILTDYVLYPTYIVSQSGNQFRFQLPLSWTFQGSVDQAVWETIDTRNVSLSGLWQTTGGGAATLYNNASEVKIVRFPINNSTPYQYYRFVNITTSFSSPVWAMSDMEFIGTPVNSDRNLTEIITRKQALEQFWRARMASTSDRAFLTFYLRDNVLHSNTANSGEIAINSNFSNLSKTIIKFTAQV